MTIAQALERTLALKAEENQHAMTPFRQMNVPTRDGRAAYCTRCWSMAWTILSVSPPECGGQAITRACIDAAAEA